MKRLLIPLILLVLAFPATAQSPPSLRVAVADITGKTARHVYANWFNAYKTPLDIFDYGSYTISQLQKSLANDNIEVFETVPPYMIENSPITNFFGGPSKFMKYWLNNLARESDADYLILIDRKYIPEKNLSHRFLDKTDYGVATYLDNPGELVVFSFVGYYIFSVRDMKLIRINSNHDRYVIRTIKLDQKLNYDELKNLPQEYLNMAVAELKNIADTRNLFITEILKEKMKYL